jgi:hypothetical protein
MKSGFEKFSFGNELWSFPEMPDDQVAALNDKIAIMSETGERVVSNYKGEISIAIPERTQSYDKWIEEMHNEFFMALANPSLKLGLEQGFTKATADTAREMFEMKISSMRREIKRNIEALWAKVLENYGFDGEAAGIKLNFGSVEIQYAVSDIFGAVDKEIITPDEAREILKKYARWDIEGPAPTPKPEPAPMIAPNTKPVVESKQSELIEKKLELVTGWLMENKEDK